MRIENSFIPVEGVGERTEQKLWSRGITEWDAFHPEAIGGKRGDRIASFIDIATDHLERNDARFFRDTFPTESHWRLYENFRTETCFLDIETTGLDKRHDDVTVVGTYRDGDTRTLVRGRDLTPAAVRRELDRSSLLVTFNGKRFDVPFLESAFDLQLDVPHVDLLYPARRIGLTGGLKTIEDTIGIDRDRPDISGRDAVRLWRAHQRGDPDALDRLCDYNREDVVNLEVVLDHVCGQLHEQVFDEALPDSPTDTVTDQ